MLVLNILVKPIWVFFIDRNVQLTVGHQDYGMYSALVSLTIIFNIVLDMGITNMNNKNLASDASEIQFSLPNMMLAKGLLSLIYFSLILGLAWILNYSGRALYVLFLLAGVQMLNSFLQYLRSYVSAHHDFKLDSVLSVLDKLLMIGMCGFLLYSSEFNSLFTIEWFIYTQLFSYFISISIAFGIVTKKYARLNLNNLSLSHMFGICKQSLPYAFLILLMGIYMRSDSLLLERLEGAVQNSYYAAAYRVLDIANMSGFLFAGILLPLFSRLIAKKHDITYILKTSTTILGSISIGFVAFCIIYSTPILTMLYPQDVEAITPLFKLTIASFPAFCFMYIFATLLTANGNINLLIRIALFGSLSSIILNLMLIHLYHATGAAFATLIVEWSLAILYIYFAQQKLQLKPTYLLMLQFVGLFVGQLLINTGLNSLNCPIILASVLNMVGFLILVYGLKLWDKNTISSYIKQFKSTRTWDRQA
jgi:O-antigen/teichoic acid export membrane protein